MNPVLVAMALFGGVGTIGPLLGLFESPPGVVLGLPLVLASSIVFAATHHESPAVIRRATLQWVGWLGGILAVVLAVVLAAGWMV